MPAKIAPPSIRFYPNFPDDWEGLPADVKQRLGTFLERLQGNPYDPELQASSEAHPPFFARRIAPGYVVYWTLKFADLADNQFSAPASIDVLHIGKVADAEAASELPSTD